MKMKKLAGFILATTFAAGGLTVASCGEKEEAQKRVMNLSLNPQVEFVLDADNKVVTVNALNEEGNLIAGAEVFVGKTAEEAAKLFVEISTETGFLASGGVSVEDNKIEISFSGDADAAKELFDDVKQSVQTYLDESGITATLTQAAAITEEAIEKLVAECAPYLEAAEIKAMEYGELLDELLASRKETADFYSQELKNAYYEAKAFALEQAELTAVRDTLDSISQIAFDVAYGGYTAAVTLIEETRQSVLVAENSPYQLALQAFRKAKTDYLTYRNQIAETEGELDEETAQRLAQLDAAVDSAEQTLLSAGVTANQTLDGLKAQVETAYTQVVTMIKEYSEKLSAHAEEISAKKTAALQTFFTEVETDYAAAAKAAKDNWKKMQNDLESANVQGE